MSSRQSSQKSLTGKKQAMATYVHNRWKKNLSVPDTAVVLKVKIIQNS